MGAVNYGSSDYITMGYNCDTKYARDDFWKDEEEQQEFEISFFFLHDEVKEELEKHSFYYFHIVIKLGYYEGFYIDIENNFPIALDSWRDRKNANKEITEIKQFLIACAELGLMQCSPGWCIGYSSYNETMQAIKKAVVLMRDEIKNTPTFTQYERSRNI